MMGVPVRVLIIEDSEPDAELLMRELQDGGYDPEYEIVETPQAMAAALDNKPWDAIIADYVMPHFSGLDALRMVQERGLDTPLIMVSGKISENVAVETMLAGAKDYVLKSNLSRLVPAVKREIIDTRRRQRAEEARRQAEEALRRAYDEQEQRVVERTAELHEANLLLSREITERKTAEEALGESEARFRAIYERAPLGIALIDSFTGKFLQINPRYCEIVGRDQEEMLKLNFQTITHPDDLQADLDNMRSLVEGRSRFFNMEKRYIHTDGSVVWVDMTIVPMWDEGEPPTFHIAMVEDITERKRAEEALRESEERYRTLFNAIDEGFCIIEVIFDENEKPIDYCFLEINAAFERQTGLIDAQGKRMRELAPMHEEHWFEIYGEIALTGQPARFQNRAEQLHRWYDVYAFRFGRPENRQVAILFNDITNRKNAEEALKQSQALLQSTIDSSNAAIYIKDSDGRFSIINDATAKFLGTVKEAIIGKTDRDLLPREAADRYCSDDRAIIRTGIPCQFEETIHKEDGDHTYISAKFPIRDADGNVFAVGGISTDITEEKRIEEALDAQRLRAEALEGIAEAGIATTDMQELLGTLTRRIAEILDVYSCCIFVLDEDSGEFVAHAACGIPELTGSRLKADEGAAGVVYRERQPVYISDAEHDPLVVHKALGSLGIKAILNIPLVTLDKVVGIARIDMLTTRTFTEEEMGMIEAMAARAAQAIDNIRLYEELIDSRNELEEALDRERYFSQLLQKTLLPETPFIGSGYSAAVKYIPAYVGQEVGGDFYDVFRVGESRAGVVIGDVAGKGLGAAALAATTRSTIHAFVHETASAGEALTRANSVVSSHQLASESFVTVSLFVVDLSTGEFTYASAGHPPAAIRRADGNVEFLELGQLPLALQGNREYQEFHNYLTPGDKLVLYTDGIMEARANSGLFDLGGIERVLRDQGHLHADNLAGEILAAASKWAGGRFKDDAAIAVVERLTES